MGMYIGTRIVQAIPADKGSYAGYFVTYPDGFTDWVISHRFHDEFMPCEGVPLGAAIEALKLGLAVRRKGWEAVNKRLVMTRRSGRESIAVLVGEHIDILWVPTQQDLLANDWIIEMTEVRPQARGEQLDLDLEPSLDSI